MDRVCEKDGCSNKGRIKGSGKRGRLCDKHHRELYPRPARYNQKKALMHNYGLTLIEYDTMVATHANKCGVCGEEMDKINVDHCHETGSVRGLLCNKCNWGLGMFNEDIDILASAVSYLLNNTRLKETA